MLVSRNLPPLQGGMERLNQHLVHELGQVCDMVIVGPHGAECYFPDVLSVVDCSASPISKFLVCASVQAVRAARRFRPSLILAGSGANAMPAWLAAGATGARWGIYLHGLDILADNYLYQKLMLPIIRKADFYLVNSNATAHVAGKAGIPDERINILHPGVKCPEAIPTADAVNNWKRSVGLDGRKVLLAVGRLTRRKGLVQFIEKALPAIVEKYPTATLTIVGSEPKNAINKDATGFAALKSVARATGVQEYVGFLGSVDDASLSLAYCAASLHVFPVLELPGDMEGFGMVSIEAAAHGRPTVAFHAGGVADAICPGVSGDLVPPGDYVQFSKSCVDWLEKSADLSTQEACRRFARQFDWAEFGEILRDLPPIRDALA